MGNDYEGYGKIICAALLHNDCIYMSEKGHHAIFLMEPIGVLKNAKQGFVTENGFFVDRKTALYIAEYFNQIANKYLPKDILMSEDLKLESKKVLKYIKEYTYKKDNEQTLSFKIISKILLIFFLLLLFL